MSDPDLAWIFQQGSRDYNSLDQKERARYVHVMYSFNKLFENIFLHYKDNLISEKVWQYNQLLLLAYAAQPGATNYWSWRRSAFDPRFRKMVDEIHSTEIPADNLIAEMDIPDITNKENET